jgi:hypothetical protein
MPLALDSSHRQQNSPTSNITQSLRGIPVIQNEDSDENITPSKVNPDPYQIQQMEKKVQNYEEIRNHPKLKSMQRAYENDPNYVPPDLIKSDKKVQAVDPLLVPATRLQKVDQLIENAERREK